MNNKLTVINHNNTEVIDSREVAEMVDKRHDNLMRDITGYIVAMEKNTALKSEVSNFFIPSTYQDSTGRTLPCFLCTKKGCDMVANKTTGEKGVIFTAAYVTAFEQMREHIQTGKPLPDTMKQALAEAKLNNSRARVASMWVKLADKVPSPTYQQICASYASTALAGREVIPLPQSEQRHYTATEIGEMFGLDKARVGKIANANGLKTDEYGKWFHDKSPYSAKEVDTFKYNDAGVQRFRAVLGIDAVGA